MPLIMTIGPALAFPIECPKFGTCLDFAVCRHVPDSAKSRATRASDQCQGDHGALSLGTLGTLPAKMHDLFAIGMQLGALIIIFSLLGLHS